MTPWSSRGPALISGSMKPEMSAVGTDIYMATQHIDPNGDLYDATGYVVASGTSFSSPMTAGAAALVKQKYPSYTPAKIKSALVNNSNANVLTYNGSTAPLNAAGAGRLDMAAALNATVTVSPQTIFFGALKQGATAAAVPLQFQNNGSSAVTLTLTGTSLIALDQTSLNLAAGATGTVNVRLSSVVPAPGNYEGQIQVSGTPTSLHIPFSYVVGDGVPYNLLPLFGDGDVGTFGQVIPDGGIAFQITDQYGVPVPNVATRFTVSSGRGGSLSQASSATDQYGIAYAVATYGTASSTYDFTASAGGLSYTFEDYAISQPTIFAGGIVNAASSALGSGIAPGSYITLYGSNLSQTTNAATSSTLPLSLDSVSVSFDVPSAHISVPGLLYYISPGQVNVQVPWELAGQSSVQIKVSYYEVSGVLTTVPISTYAPAVFVYGRNLAAALDEKNILISSTNAAQRGHVISLYANGLGPVTNQPASGAPAPSSPLAQTTQTPSVTIGGVAAPVQFSGLAPGFTGLYQINVTVPSSIAAGTQPVVVNIGGVASTSVSLNVQ